jgi:hypothetical protein
MARTVRGTKSMPMAMRPHRKSARRPVVSAISDADRPEPEAMAVSVAIRRMAMRSSKMSTPTTSWRTVGSTRCSVKALAMMVVLEMATMAPVNTLSRVVQPNRRPATKPSQAMRLVSTTAVSPAVGPRRKSFRRLSSSPRENMTKITPSSDSVCTIWRSATSGTGTFGPTISPARM